MKRKLFLLSAALITMCFVLSAQTVTPIKYKTIYGKIIDYGVQATMTTTDSALHTIATLSTADNEAGVVEVTVVGYNDSLGIAVTGTQIVRYTKLNDTITVGSPSNVLAKATDGGLGTATWAIASNTNDVYVTVKGKLTYNIQWRVIFRKVYQTE